jgi:hypothetical protein
LGLSNDPQQRRIIYIEMVRATMEEQGLTKREFSKVHFIGDPEWVQESYAALRDEMKERYLFSKFHRCFDYLSIKPNAP